MKVPRPRRLSVWRLKRGAAESHEVLSDSQSEFQTEEDEGSSCSEEQEEILSSRRGSATSSRSSGEHSCPLDDHGASNRGGSVTLDGSRRGSLNSDNEPPRRCSVNSSEPPSPRPEYNTNRRGSLSGGTASASVGCGSHPRRSSSTESFNMPKKGWQSPIGSSAELDMRFFVLDNSGSTRKLDGWILVNDGDGHMRVVDTDRWCETTSIALSHAEWNLRHGVRSQFVLLNPPSPKRPAEGRDYVTVDPRLPHHHEQLAVVSQVLRKNGPCGNTPLTSRLKQLRLRILQDDECATEAPGPCSPRGQHGHMPLSPRGQPMPISPRGQLPVSPRGPIPVSPRQPPHSPRPCPSAAQMKYAVRPKNATPHTSSCPLRIALTIITDGLPTATDSTCSTAADKDAFVREIKEWAYTFDCTPVIRLTTDRGAAVAYYKRIQDVIDFTVEVVDDLHGEARRALRTGNGWLTYSPQVHKIREGGAAGNALGKLTVRLLSFYEIVEVLEWLLRTPTGRPLPRDAANLFHVAEKHIAKLPLVYNGKLHTMTPPVDLKLLKRALGLDSTAQRFRAFPGMLARAFCVPGPRKPLTTG